jgi:hypothetical protein
MFSFTIAGALFLAFTVSAFAQETVVTKKEVKVNPDGSYSVIEYPVGKEVMVNLLPTATIKGGKGLARITRSDNGTAVHLEVSSVPANVTTYYVYAVDPTGTPTLLGPVTFQNGGGTAEFTTPLNQFMVVLSPTEALTGYDANAAVVFRSDVPQGYVIVPRKPSGDTKAVAVESSVITKYDVPLLNVPSFSDKTKEVKIKFTGELAGLEGKAYIERKKGVSKVTMHFDDMKKVPANKRFVLWASSPDGQYTKLGQVINSGKREEAEINSETSLTDFGLFVTVEDVDVTIPTSRIYSIFG